MSRLPWAPLGTLAARPQWNTAVLGPLFLASGVSTGAAFQRQILTAPPVPQDQTPEALDRYRLVSALHAKFTGAASAPAPVAPARPVVRPAGAKKGGGC